MQVKTWLEINGLTNEMFGVLVDADHSTVSRWKDGLRIPRPKQMNRIVKVTKGQVKVQDFYS